jgi:hypothetical protein
MTPLRDKIIREKRERNYIHKNKNSMERYSQIEKG